MCKTAYRLRLDDPDLVGVVDDVADDDPVAVAEHGERAVVSPGGCCRGARRAILDRDDADLAVAVPPDAR